jgi:hypothetical protein
MHLSVIVERPIGKIKKCPENNTPCKTRTTATTKSCISQSLGRETTHWLKRLLGLSLIFCIEQNHPKPAIEATIQKKKRSIRIRHWLDQQPENNNENEYIPGLYFYSEWMPPLVSPQTEQRLIAFESKL